VNQSNQPLYEISVNNVTEGIQNTTVSQLIEMDRTYIDRIAIRKEIMAKHPENVLQADPSAKAAIDEFYIWLVETYLPTRFPKMFQLRTLKTPSGVSKSLYCLATRTSVPVEPCSDALDTLRILGGLVDEDFLFLLPMEDGQTYVLKAFVACFPHGFDWKKKFNKTLSEIHQPVPGYQQRLQTSMERTFARLPVNKFISRLNVSK
jgi:Protein of unknown function (DUF3445)